MKLIEDDWNQNIVWFEMKYVHAALQNAWIEAETIRDWVAPKDKYLGNYPVSGFQSIFDAGSIHHYSNSWSMLISQWNIIQKMP